MAFPILGTPKPQFLDSSGAPLDAGTVSILNPADDTNKASYPTYDDAEALTNPNSNPLTLDARGEPSVGLWGIEGEDYKVTVRDSLGATIWTVDDIGLPSTRLNSTANGFGASKIGVEDAASNFTATNVEAVLAEIISNLAAVTTGAGASTVGVEDAAGNLAATNVEAAIAEIFTLLANPASTLLYGGTPQTLSGAGAVDVTSAITWIETTGADALTLADGAEGQRKYIVMKTDGGDGTLTPSNLGNGTTITFDDVGDSADLLFTNAAWHFMGGTATLA